MKSILSFSCFVLMAVVAPTLTAQSPADELLQELEENFNSQEEAEFTFRLVIDMPEQPEIVKSGILKKSGKKYHLSLDEAWFRSDGETQWIYDPDLNEVQIYNAGESSGLPFSPDQFSELYKESGFDYAITGEDQLDGKAVQYIEFKPQKGQEEDVAKMRLAVEREKALPVYLKIFNRDGSRYSLEIKNVKTGVSYSPSEFVFRPEDAPDVNIEDLRM